MRSEGEGVPPRRAAVHRGLDEHGQGVNDIGQGEDREHDDDLDLQPTTL